MEIDSTDLVLVCALEGVEDTAKPHGFMHVDGFVG